MADSYYSYYLGNYIIRLARGSAQLTLRALAFSSKCLDDLTKPPTKIIKSRRDSDEDRPYQLDALSGNDPTHPNYNPRYPKV